jgi:hypothetical protein
MLASNIEFNKSEATMKKFTFLLVAVSFFIASPVMAEQSFVDGNRLLLDCISAIDSQEKNITGEPYKMGHCNGYISGTFDVFSAIFNFMNKNMFCAPQNAQLGQFIKIAIKYLEAHPEKLHFNAAPLLYDAFKDAYPCPESQPEK